MDTDILHELAQEHKLFVTIEDAAISGGYGASVVKYLAEQKLDVEVIVNGIPDAYNQLKELTRGKDISKEAIQEFIKSLDVLSDEDKATLLALTPAGYTGFATKIVEDEL